MSLSIKYVIYRIEIKDSKVKLFEVQFPFGNLFESEEEALEKLVEYGVDYTDYSILKQYYKEN